MTVALRQHMRKSFVRALTATGDPALASAKQTHSED